MAIVYIAYTFYRKNFLQHLFIYFKMEFILKWNFFFCMHYASKHLFLDALILFT